MNLSIKLEELCMLLLSMLLFSWLPFQWWWFPALFLLPDIGLIGYLFNPKIGAWSYNLFHHKGVAFLVYLLGIYIANYELQLVGIILFGHSSFDRMLGYGLKHEDSFQNTHLGKIGKE